MFTRAFIRQVKIKLRVGFQLFILIFSFHSELDSRGYCDRLRHSTKFIISARVLDDSLTFPTDFAAPDRTLLGRSVFALYGPLHAHGTTFALLEELDRFIVSSAAGCPVSGSS